MSVTHRIDAIRHLVVTRAEGAVAPAEIISANESLALHPDFDPKFDQLCDGTAADRMLVDAEVMEAVVSSSPFGPTSRRAIVVVSDTSYGLARMFQSLAEGRHGEIGVFRTLSEARAWLERE